MLFITAVQVLVNMHWRLRSQGGAHYARVARWGVVLAMLAGGTPESFVVLHAPGMCWCTHQGGSILVIMHWSLHVSEKAAGADSWWLKSPWSCIGVFVHKTVQYCLCKLQG